MTTSRRTSPSTTPPKSAHHSISRVVRSGGGVEAPGVVERPVDVAPLRPVGGRADRNRRTDWSGGTHRPQRAGWPGLEVGWTLHPDHWGNGLRHRSRPSRRHVGLRQSRRRRAGQRDPVREHGESAVATRLGFTWREDRILQPFVTLPHGIWTLPADLAQPAFGVIEQREERRDIRAWVADPGRRSRRAAPAPLRRPHRRPDATSPPW